MLYPAELRARRPTIMGNTASSVNPTNKKAPPEGGVFGMAEREGFEPSMGVKAHTPLAGEPLRPLGHLSGTFCLQQPARGQVA